MNPTNGRQAERVAGQSARTVSILICGLAACATPVDPSPSENEMLQRLETIGARETACATYLPASSAADNSVRRCYRVAESGSGFVGRLAEALPAKPGEDLSRSLRWDLVSGTDLGDGCSVDLLNNVRPYGYRDAEGRRGWSVFWVVDRTECDEETLVAVTTWVPTMSSP